MSSPRQEERQQIILIGVGVAGGTALAASLMRHYPWVIWPYGGFLVMALGYVVAQLIRVKRQNAARRKSLAASRKGRA